MSEQVPGKIIVGDQLATLQKSLGGDYRLSDDEVGFIRRAKQLRSLSESLHARLAESITCSGAHKAWLHLTGFLDVNVEFELLVSNCENTTQKLLSCRLDDKPRTGDGHPIRGLICDSSQPDLVSHSRLSMFLSANQCCANELDGGVPDGLEGNCIHDLWDLLSARDGEDDHSDSESETAIPKFADEDKKILELVVASSLLNAESFLNANWSIKNIHLKRNTESTWCWKPYLSFAIRKNDAESISHDAVLSFGLFLLEIETGRVIRPRKGEVDCESGLPMRSRMLERAIRSSKRFVGDGYIRIAQACLQFESLSHLFYDPRLTRDLTKTASVYKYILAPLHVLIRQQHSTICTQFDGIPHQQRRLSTAQDGQTIPDTELQLFDDMNSTVPDPMTIQRGMRFLEYTTNFAQLLSQLPPIPVWAETYKKENIRIAIIDTGIDHEDTIIEAALQSSRIKHCCGFVSSLETGPDHGDFRDHHGHGTHIARLVLQIAPTADIYVAKVANDSRIQRADLHRVTRAIEWAHRERQVHIIVLSLGLQQTADADMDRAIQAAYKSSITLFAAAANSGGNMPRAYPASRSSGVVCVHASDGLGNDGGINPSPLDRRDNFSTLGISVVSRWKGDDVVKSGTSFATAIAAALAANMLEFARRRCDLDGEQFARLCDYGGMCDLLRLIARPRNGYDYIMPGHLFTQVENQEIVRLIHQIAGR